MVGHGSACRRRRWIPGSPLLEPRRVPYIYNVTVGGRSAGFIGGSHSRPITTGLPEGTYEAITPSGATLVYTGTNQTNGYYIFTDSDGSVINFAGGGQPQRIQDQLLPDGTMLAYGYDPVTGLLRSVISNRGYAILIQPGTGTGSWKACAVNLTQHVVTATSACPAGVQTVAYSFAPVLGRHASPCSPARPTPAGRRPATPMKAPATQPASPG